MRKRKVSSISGIIALAVMIFFAQKVLHHEDTSYNSPAEANVVHQDNDADSNLYSLPKGGDNPASEKPASNNDGKDVENSSISEPAIVFAAKMRHTPERIIRHFAYTLSFNRETNEPNWVGWCLENYETEGNLGRGEFQPDPDIPLPHRVVSSDYRNSGYDRGHNAPSADMKFDPRAMRECFYMSNICPQTHTLNAGAWERLESACRRWARKFGKVTIVCGPVFSRNKARYIGDEHQIRVPDAFFKCIYAVNKGKPQAIAFIMPNKDEKLNMLQQAVSVDEAELRTGIDFFPSLPDKIETAVEKSYSLKLWS